jgi:hypothetical protein
MKVMKGNAVVLLASVLALAACKAEKVDISLDAAMIQAAANGTAGEVEFEASVGERYTTVDPEKRAQIDAVQSLIQQFFPDADIELDIASDEYEIEVEGTLAISSGTPSSGAPWHVSATPATDGPGIIVQLLPSAAFPSFEAALQEINFMLGPDTAQPVEFRFTASSGTVIVGGAIVDGMPTGVARIPMTGQTVRMLFEEGIWDELSGTFLYIP